ncbi:SpoIIE family protein phosphatase [Draconibacterium halophilum]|uniref:SpoIIE family protein phosphatase n=1 Tax=Draconibacterium halophilum TaxID=2706887 RepID=A0A6C0RFE9_9BACT|nr:SpoIIE family protein phosphatase [Draconibacterium halophilum]QIA08253.1 SpoIIE family protein phosphatase [Draconibacterium halophilum]
MLNKSIAYQLSVYISLAVIGVFITFIGIFFLFNQTLIEDSVKNKAMSQSAHVTSSVQRYIITTSEIAGNIADQVIFYGQQDHADLFIQSLVNKYQFINAIYVKIDSTVTDLPYWSYFTYRDGDSILIQRGSNSFSSCANEQEQFEKLVAQEGVGWSEPYLCERNNIVVAAYCAPIMIENPSGQVERVGEVICEMSLNELNKQVNSLKIGKGGFAFLMSKDGVFITHPVSEWILNRSIYDSNEKILKEDITITTNNVLADSKPGTLIAYPELFNFEKALVYYVPIEQNGWVLVSVLPYKELFEPLYLPVLQMLFFSVLGILIIYLTVTYIINRQIKPLSLVTKQLKRFSNLTGPYKDIPENEVVQVAESLNYMKLWYEKYLQTQSDEHKKKLQRQEDMNQASEIQQSFIKTIYPAFPDRTDIDLYTTYQPARGVSGDLFDYFFIDDEHLVLTMGDVSGKGVPAAFFMSVAQTIIKTNALVPKADEIVKRTNKELCTTNHHQFFLTLFLGVLNVKTGILEYCNAAHTPAYNINKNGKIKELAQSHGLPLGLYPDKSYGSAKIQLEKGDTLVLYTDGVTEMLDENNVQYGNQQLVENLKSLAGQSPKEMVERLEKSFKIHYGHGPQSDDITMLIFKYKA